MNFSFKNYVFIKDMRSPRKLGELAAADDVQAWLVLMHAGQNDLEEEMIMISYPF